MLLMWLGVATGVRIVRCRDVRSRCAGLVDAGLIRSVTAFDLFPNTAHVERVAVLER